MERRQAKDIWREVVLALNKLTAAMDGFLSSPAGGCVTSAPMKITGLANTAGLETDTDTHGHS